MKSSARPHVLPARWHRPRVAGSGCARLASTGCADAACGGSARADRPCLPMEFPMQYRRLGRSGLPLSVLSFGAWATFGKSVGRSQARDLLADLRFPRDSWCVSSKVYFGPYDHPKPTQRGLSRKHVIEACHQALARLRVDYLDLYFCHRPDEDTPVTETVAAMDLLVRQGKVLYWGTSEWPADAIVEAHRVAKENHLAAPVMEQPQYNLLHRERVEVEYAPLYDKFGMGTTIWS